MFKTVLKRYGIDHRLRQNGRPIRYENISGSNESDTISTGLISKLWRSVYRNILELIPKRLAKISSTELSLYL